MMTPTFGMGMFHPVVQTAAPPMMLASMFSCTTMPPTATNINIFDEEASTSIYTVT